MRRTSGIDGSVGIAVLGAQGVERMDAEVVGMRHDLSARTPLVDRMFTLTAEGGIGRGAPLRQGAGRDTIEEEVRSKDGYDEIPTEWR